MRHQLISLILAALLPLLLVLPAAAQDATSTPFVFCGDLDDADCVILEESALAMLDVTSSAFAIQFDTSVGGMPDMPVDPIDFSFNITGNWAVDGNAKDAIRSLGALRSEDPVAAAQALSENMPQIMIDMYDGLNFDGSLTWDVPQAVADLIAEDSDVPFPPTLTWNMRLVDGMLYIDLSEIKALAPELDTIEAQWIGIDLVGLMQLSMEQNKDGATAPDGTLATSVGSGVITAQVLQWMQEYITVERLDDTTVETQQAAVFQYTPDVLGYLTSKAFRTELTKLLAASEASGKLDPEMEKNIGMLGFVAPMLFQDLTIDRQNTIGLDDYYNYDMQFEFKWDLSGIMALAAMSEGSGLERPSPEVAPAVNMSLDATYGDYDQPFEFAAPEDVEIIPLDQLVPTDTSLVY